MFTSKISVLSLLALATSSAFAAPTPSESKLDKRMASTCNREYKLLFDVYSVWIEAPYADGIGCDSVYNALVAHSTSPSNWQCVDDGTGMTQLWFNTVVFATDGVNQALNDMYPDVGGYNCL
jgi:hypothetical protein